MDLSDYHNFIICIAFMMFQILDVKKSISYEIHTQEELQG